MSEKQSWQETIYSWLTSSIMTGLTPDAGEDRPPAWA